MDGRTQTGIAACASIDDYANQVIKKHENTRADKEQDRICHVDTETVIGFLKAHGLDKDFKVNIEVNHATLAGHTFELHPYPGAVVGRSSHRV